MTPRDAQITMFAAQFAMCNWLKRDQTALRRAIHQYALATNTNYILLYQAVIIEAVRLYGCMVAHRERRHD